MSKQRTGRTSTCPIPGPKETVTIRLPVAPLIEQAYVGDHVDVHLDYQQARAMRQTLNGLKNSATRLANDRIVQSYGDVVRYMLEQVHADLNRS